MGILLAEGLLDESAFLAVNISVKGDVGRISSASDLVRVARVLHAETIRSNKLGSSEDSTIDVVREQSKFQRCRYSRKLRRTVEAGKMGRWEDGETSVG